MKIAKILLSITTVLFALLGLLKVLAFEISQPLAMFSLATLLLIRAIEDKKKNDKLGFVIGLVLTIFLYTIIVYNSFIG